MCNPLTLEGKRILVTGASSGIGRACAELIAELGAQVILVARRRSCLEEVRLGLTNPDQHQVLSADLADLSQIDEMMSLTVQRGRLDGLVHAAGIGPQVPIGFQDAMMVRSVFGTNYFSFLELMKRLSKAKFRADTCSIVAISSISALAGWGGVSAYAGSKGAISATVRSLAIELASKHVRVNAVCPGHTRTPMLDAENEQKLLAKQPLGIVEPRQVANAVAYLLSDASRFVTGVNLPIDGGYLAQ